MFLRGKSARRFRFDETLGRGSGTAWELGEGTDYLLQLLSEGASLYYEPSLNVIHPQGARRHLLRATGHRGVGPFVRAGPPQHLGDRRALLRTLRRG